MVLLAPSPAATTSSNNVRTSIPLSLSFATVLGAKTDAIIVVAFDDNINCTLSPSPSPSHSNTFDMVTVIPLSAAEEEESEEQQKLWWSSYPPAASAAVAGSAVVNFESMTMTRTSLPTSTTWLSSSLLLIDAVANHDCGKVVVATSMPKPRTQPSPHDGSRRWISSSAQREC